MLQRLRIAGSDAGPDFHDIPQHAPPSPNRKPRVLSDPDLSRDTDNDPDLETSSLHALKLTASSD